MSAPDHTEHKKIKVNRMTTQFQKRIRLLGKTNPDFLFDANNIDLIIPNDTEANLLLNVDIQLSEHNDRIFRHSNKSISENE